MERRFAISEPVNAKRRKRMTADVKLSGSEVKFELVHPNSFVEKGARYFESGCG